jgi:hypothetical protein
MAVLSENFDELQLFLKCEITCHIKLLTLQATFTTKQVMG